MKQLIKLTYILAALFLAGCGGSDNRQPAQNAPANNTKSVSTQAYQPKWTTYGNNNGNSGIVAYRIGSDYIDVKFRSGKKTVYRYSYDSAGKSKVEEMKLLARQGSGLNGYINRNARKLYESSR